jgi:hypothetical protein
MLAKEIVKSITDITRALIEHGICDEQNYVSTSIEGNYCEVVYSGYADLSIALKNVSYSDIYDELCKNKQFNFRLLDGGLIQILYRVNNDNVIGHRLCYFPSPSFESFQNEPDLYLDESNYYADMIDRSILPVPVRFDFDPQNQVSIYHPASHLTLGQFKNCRIPVRAPICPATFVNFILLSFYHTAALEMPHRFEKRIFNSTLTDDEVKMMHLSFS